jgi:hypothetical protein
MVKSDVERQRAYRARLRLDETAPKEWLRTVIDLHAKRALERLARHHGVTQRAMLERAILEAQARVFATMDGADHAKYYRN